MNVYGNEGSRWSELSLGAQTSYAELLDMAMAVEAAPFAALRGSFHRRHLKGNAYVYFNYRDVSGKAQSAYIGPEERTRTQELVNAVQLANVAGRLEPLKLRARACIALGCATVPEGDFKLIYKLGSFGLFRWGAVLIGRHAFTALGTMLGVRWMIDQGTARGPAQPENRISIALPTGFEVPERDAITALEQGLLPIQSNLMSGPRIETGKYALLNSFRHRPLRNVMFGRSGACIVTLPDPARFAIQQLILYGSTSIGERNNADVELEQAASLIAWHMDYGRGSHLLDAWQDALHLGSECSNPARAGMTAMLARYPALANALVVTAP